MGSPLSSLLADIFMNKPKNEIFSSANPLHHPHITYWYRYSDDVLYLRTRPANLIPEILDFINSFYPSIMKFTVSIGGNQINFLYLAISVNDNFNMHRKPTATDITIHNTSYHTFPPHEYAAVLSMIRLPFISLESLSLIHI